MWIKHWAVLLETVNVLLYVTEHQTIHTIFKKCKEILIGLYCIIEIDDVLFYFKLNVRQCS